MLFAHVRKPAAFTSPRHAQPAFAGLLRFPEGFGGHPGHARDFPVEEVVALGIGDQFAGNQQPPAARLFLQEKTAAVPQNLELAYHVD